LGIHIVLVEELDWLGGQLTAQGVPLDEHPWVETGIGSRSYAMVRQSIREYYLRHYPLTADARARWPFNPGMGNVGTLCHEPKVAVRVIDDLLAPFESSGQVTVLRRHALVDVDINGDRIVGVTLRNLETGKVRTSRRRLSLMRRKPANCCNSAGSSTSSEQNLFLKPASCTHSPRPILSISKR
jgi:hypothetical protein